MSIFIIYLLAISILVFVVILAIRTIMKIRKVSPRNVKDDENDDLISKLKELNKLYEDGSINRNEFKLAKEKLLTKELSRFNFFLYKLWNFFIFI